MGARDNFVKHLCASVESIEDETVAGMRFGRLSPFFRKDMARLKSSAREVTLLTVGHPSRFGGLADWPKAVAALRRNLGGLATMSGSAEAAPQPKPVPRSNGPKAPLGQPIDATAVRPRQSRAAPGTVYEAVRRPPADFGYQPIHDFWQELSKLGPTSIEAMHRHMLSLGWSRPSGKPLTYDVMRIDMVSMAKHGFARRVDG